MKQQVFLPSSPATDGTLLSNGFEKKRKEREREAGRGEVGWGSGRTTVVKATANRYFILSQSLKSGSPQ